MEHTLLFLMRYPLESSFKPKRKNILTTLYLENLSPLSLFTYLNMHNWRISSVVLWRMKVLTFEHIITNLLKNDGTFRLSFPMSIPALNLKTIWSSVTIGMDLLWLFIHQFPLRCSLYDVASIVFNSMNGRYSQKRKHQRMS